MEIRKATQKDVEILSQMNYEFNLSEKKVSDKYMKVKSINYFRKRIKEHLKKRDMIFLIAEHGENVVGFSKGLVESYKKDYEKLDKVGFIAITYVRKNYRKKGVGRKLSNYMISELKKRKVKMVTVFHYASNKVAVEFAKHRGFKQHAIELRKFI